MNKMLSGATVLLMMSTIVASNARAEDFIVYNGLPCGAFCQKWMGIAPKQIVELPEKSQPAADEFDRPARISSRAVAAEAEAPFQETPSTSRRNRRERRDRATTMLAQSMETTSDAPSPGLARRHDGSRAHRHARGGHGERRSPIALAMSEPVTLVNPVDRGRTRPIDQAKGTGDPPAPTVTPAAGQAAAPPSQTPDLIPRDLVDRQEALEERKTEVAPQPASRSIAAAPSDIATEQQAAPSSPEKKDITSSSGTLPVGLAENEEVKKLAAQPRLANIGSGRVLIMLTKADINSPADLRNKAVVIAGLKSVSPDLVRSALNAAGCDTADLSRGTKSDIDRLIVGEVSAAIVAVIPSGGSDGFPDITGLKVFRLQLPAG